jgi:hypothetical protein
LQYPTGTDDGRGIGVRAIAIATGDIGTIAGVPDL